MGMNGDVNLHVSGSGGAGLGLAAASASLAKIAAAAIAMIVVSALLGREARRGWMPRPRVVPTLVAGLNGNLRAAMGVSAMAERGRSR